MTASFVNTALKEAQKEMSAANKARNVPNEPIRHATGSDDPSAGTKTVKKTPITQFICEKAPPPCRVGSKSKGRNSQNRLTLS